MSRHVDAANRVIGDKHLTFDRLRLESETLARWVLYAAGLIDEVEEILADRDEIAARAAARQVEHAAELAAVADRIIETLGATDLQIGLAHDLREKAGAV